MSNKSMENIDLKSLLDNLRDLDDVSQKISKEMENKNQILKGGLDDCKTCQMYIQNSRKNKTATK